MGIKNSTRFTMYLNTVFHLSFFSAVFHGLNSGIFPATPYSFLKAPFKFRLADYFLNH